jgi:hypothetical protein
MARTRTKAGLWSERLQKVKRQEHVVRIFTGENDEEWKQFLQSLPDYAQVRVGPICPHYRTADKEFNWSSYQWPVN